MSEMGIKGDPLREIISKLPNTPLNCVLDDAKPFINRSPFSELISTPSNAPLDRVLKAITQAEEHIHNLQARAQPDVIDYFLEIHLFSQSAYRETLYGPPPHFVAGILAALSSSLNNFKNRPPGLITDLKQQGGDIRENCRALILEEAQFATTECTVPRNDSYWDNSLIHCFMKSIMPGRDTPWAHLPNPPDYVDLPLDMVSVSRFKKLSIDLLRRIDNNWRRNTLPSKSIIVPPDENIADPEPSPLDFLIMKENINETLPQAAKATLSKIEWLIFEDMVENSDEYQERGDIKRAAASFEMEPDKFRAYRSKIRKKLKPYLY